MGVFIWTLIVFAAGLLCGWNNWLKQPEWLSKHFNKVERNKEE